MPMLAVVKIHARRGGRLTKLVVNGLATRRILDAIDAVNSMVNRTALPRDNVLGAQGGFQPARRRNEQLVAEARGRGDR